MAKKLVKALIGDKQELEFILSDPGSPFDGVEITIRPCLPEEGYEYSGSLEPWKDRGPKFIFSHLYAWNVSLDGETISPCTLESCKTLFYPVARWMIDCILGYIIPSPKTGKTQAEIDQKNLTGPSA